jgi:predicted RNA-binding Zn-ribbon protein involved in translation (DUF1610 family)
MLSMDSQMDSLGGAVFQSDAMRYKCPKCGAEPGKKCRTMTTNRSTDDHESRWRIAYHARGVQ